MTDIIIAPLCPDSFAPFGQVIDALSAPVMINAGNCARYHDVAQPDIHPSGHVGISLFVGQPYGLPLTINMMERHPMGSQAFMPMSRDPFLVTVAEDEGGRPGTPRSFLTAPGQGVQIGRNVWHGVLTPLWRPARFAVIDYIGPEPNLQEHWFAQSHCAYMPANLGGNAP